MKRIALFVIVGMMSSFAWASLTDGLVGYWPFDGNANDISGNGNNGMIHGVTLTTDRHGNSDNAYHFDGKSWIEVANSRSLHNITAEITIAAWIKPTSWSDQTDEGDKWLTVLQKGSSSNHYEFQYGRWAKEGVSYVSLDYWNGAFIKNKSVNIPSLGVWQFVAITLSAGKLKSYKNGVLQDSLNVGVALVPNGSSLYIGANPVGDCEYFIGTMDNVAIYNRALSASEIKALSKFVPTTLEIRTVSFNPNVGLGEMEDDVFEEGKKQKLPKNTYTKDGYVFQGWAESKANADNGIVKFRDEAEIVVDHDMTLYAVWANPALTLVAESADWSSGSITLCCTDVDTSGAAHAYMLQYYDEGAAEWKNVTSVQSASVGVSLTDTGFSSRLGGIPLVKYRVKDENGRVTEECVTRNRYGIFVGVGHYSNEYQKKCMWYGGGEPLDDLPGVEGSTQRYAVLARDNGGFAFAVGPLLGTSATTENVDAAFITTAETVSPGDVCLFYVATHGGVLSKDNGGLKKGTAVLALYDDDYSEFRLKDGIDLLSAKNAAVICILSACQSEALVRQSMANVAVIAAANYKGSTTELFDEILLDYGWKDGWAGTGGMLTFGALAGYVEDRYNALFRGISLQEGDELTTRDVQIENRGMLSRITAGTCGTHGSLSPPATPSGFTATQAEYKNKIKLSWDDGGNVEYYVFYGGVGGGVYENYTNTCKTSMTFLETDFACVESSSESSPVPFEIRALNKAGVSSSAYAQGWVDGTWRVVFWAGNGKMVGDWMGMPVQRNTAGFEYFEKVMQRPETLSLTSLPQATRDGYICTGWISENQGTCTKASVGMVLSKESNGMRFVANWTAMTTDYLDKHPSIAAASGGDIATAAAMTSANGCRTVGECYALGIDPEDPNDDLKITDFKMVDGKPVIKLNHTVDGSGNSFLPRAKTLGKSSLTGQEEWREVPEEGDPDMRFFKVAVEMP